jgi:hypothetical protein
MNAQERVPVQQLRTLFGATLAAAHYGLQNWLQLGQQSTFITHRQPYARFVMGLIEVGTTRTGAAGGRDSAVEVKR